MTDTNATVSASPLQKDASPDTTAKDHIVQSVSDPSSESPEIIKEHHELDQGQQPKIAAGTSTSCIVENTFSELSKELRNTVTAIHKLQMAPNWDSISARELQSLLKQQKALAQMASKLDTTMFSKSPSTIQTHWPVSLQFPLMNAQFPYVRLITHGMTTLVHLGQLVGILDNYSGFLLQRVVSFNANRVDLRVMGQLKPSEILDLTDSKRDRLQQEEARQHRDNPFAQVITTTTSLESENTIADMFFASRCNNRTTSFGPVLTTPGFVLVRSDQLRELCVIDENTELNSQGWELSKPDGQKLQQWEQFQIEQQYLQQQREQNYFTTLGISPTATSSGGSPVVNVVLGNEQPVTPISRASQTVGHSSQVTAQPSEHTQKTVEQTANCHVRAKRATGTVTSAEAAHAAQPKEKIANAESNTGNSTNGTAEAQEGAQKRRRTPRRRGGRGRANNSGQKNAKNNTRTNAASAVQGQTVQVCSHDSGIAAMPNVQQPQLPTCQGCALRIVCPKPYNFRRPNFMRPGRRWNYPGYQSRWYPGNYFYGY